MDFFRVRDLGKYVFSFGDIKSVKECQKVCRLFKELIPDVEIPYWDFSKHGKPRYGKVLALVLSNPVPWDFWKNPHLTYLRTLNLDRFKTLLPKKFKFPGSLVELKVPLQVIRDSMFENSSHLATLIFGTLPNSHILLPDRDYCFATPKIFQYLPRLETYANYSGICLRPEETFSSVRKCIDYSLGWSFPPNLCFNKLVYLWSTDSRILPYLPKTVQYLELKNCQTKLTKDSLSTVPNLIGFRTESWFIDPLVFQSVPKLRALDVSIILDNSVFDWLPNLICFMGKYQKVLPLSLKMIYLTAFQSDRLMEKFGSPDCSIEMWKLKISKVGFREYWFVGKNLPPIYWMEVDSAGS